MPTDDDRDSIDLLLAFVADRDVPCPCCGYNLRTLRRPECPECRQPLRLQVGGRRPPLGWLLAALAPSIFSGIAAGMLGVMMIVFGPPPQHIFVLDAIGWLSALGGLVLFLLRYRFMALPPPAQAAAACATWLVHVGLFVGFLLLA